MSERKVLNKYFPPDFDPAKIPRRKMAADRQQVVRLMAPFSMRCNTCGEFIYKGKKFNARKETVLGEVYYGIRIFRFYIKCTRCSAEITFKTDPKNTDYTAEHGASRNFEPWRDERGGGGGGGDGEAGPSEDPDADPLAHLIEEEEGQKRDAELDPMKALEARTRESKREMEVLDALQDIQSRNARNERADTNAILDRLAKGKGRAEEDVLDPEEEERRRLEEEDEVLVRKFFSRAEDVPLGNDDEEDVLGEGLVGAATQAGPEDDDASEHARQISTPATASTSKGKERAGGSSSSGLTVKRAISEVEPEITSLLSEKARALLSSSSSSNGAKTTNSTMLPPSATATSSSVSRVGGGGGPVKKKQKANAFGIVRKK
ncbi:unnamed protein product [Tilletia controversa]|nr:unnamed protein product [Tilletia controversa]